MPVEFFAYPFTIDILISVLARYGIYAPDSRQSVGPWSLGKAICRCSSRTSTPLPPPVLWNVVWTLWLVIDTANHRLPRHGGG